jgi:Amt family ammonium transporter
MLHARMIEKGAVALLALLPGVALAEEVVVNGANTAWILTATALVLFMSLPGLALFYGGLVRTRNVLSILMQCFSIAAIASILWLLVGYSIAFTDGNGGWLGGFSNLLFANIREDTVSGDLPESLFALFQMTFAIITPALIIGGFAERMKFSSVLLFSAIWLLVVYAPITHWVWGGGWLGEMGLLDFAGGTVVHITAGVAALVAAMVLGPRNGFGTTAMPPHNMTMTVTGAGMLWVGWFGFNGGSALAANGDAAMAIVVTHISASAGAITWMFYEWKKFGMPTALGTVTGMVAGLGTITPASGFVGPGGALIIGVVAGAVCFNMVILVKKVWKIDDSLDVFPVHGVGGILGTFMAGIFASDQLGLFSGQGLAEGVTIADQVWVQTVGIVATALYTALATWVILKLVALMTDGLRVSSDEEAEGLDIVSHEERGYDL